MVRCRVETSPAFNKDQSKFLFLDDGEEGAIIFQSDRDQIGTRRDHYEIYRWDGKRKYERLTDNEAMDFYPVN